MSRKRKIIIAIVLVIVISVIYVFKFTETGNYVRYALTVYDSKVSDFKKYKNDYQLIVDKIIDLKKRGVITKDNRRVDIEDGKMFDANYIEIKLTKAERNSIANIEKTFDEKYYPLSTIRVYEDNYIAFMPEGYPFGVVYSENGNKPSSLGLLNEEDRNYKVRRLTPKWYDVEDR